jgi:hypothetical protein
LFHGRLSAPLLRAEASRETLGLLMGGANLGGTNLGKTNSAEANADDAPRDPGKRHAVGA